ncbi:hypothetical protein B0T26DRAFT_732305 [Lasiosphaeria miniovina]|uniref:Uncharacterized protein n=1 Tax=Lasiosphaeria miniovina TaxID=1954250 RepID=A0AA40DJI6_9PEZI|nr:uncharacterized protein B0T26DRAFT_732305 [Lasiosphaeria miniovina]KAK0703701.1 hypothetical protein B0T26DRAFT_732305 [Lasiosphaeria miniovina]
MPKSHEHPPRKHLHNPTGYTDEAAEECHDLIDRAEHEAHLFDDNGPMSGPSGEKNMSNDSSSSSMPKKKPGLESSSSEAKSSSSIGEKMEGMKDNMKESMHMNK